MSAPRLPPRPALSWNGDTPVSGDIGDIYFSGDGLAESREVFLAGCGLPALWAGRSGFTIGELGFGSGLNLLAAWDLWRRTRPTPMARLTFVSVEGAPMGAADAARVHARWPELDDLSALLVSNWPDRARGVQAIDLAPDVRLILAIDDVGPALAGLDARIDAWFLDGFAPAKNPDMWSPAVCARLADLSAPGARLATYTVAGGVRRALGAAGFVVDKRAGHGRKKERLEGRLAEPRGRMAHALAPSHVAIIGAGVAGAWAARACLDRGCEVTILDAHDGPGAAASGNPLALVMPRLDATDTPEARALVAAFLHARRAWRTLGAGAVQPLSVRRLPSGDIERRRFQRLASDPPLCEQVLGPIDPDDPAAGLLLEGCLAIRPDLALPRLLAGARLVGDTRVTAIEAGDGPLRLRYATGDALEADHVIVAAGADPARLAGVSAPPIERRMGQVESQSLECAPFASADGGYVVSALGYLVFGATFEPAPEAPPATSDRARVDNLSVLHRLKPDLGIDPAGLVSRVGVRATTRDRLPFAGTASNDPRISLIGGLGARGFLWAPMLADLVASDMFGDPCPMEAAVRGRLQPGRRALAARPGAT
jgi:tRNA 5-methylaminomethyl-2-thiouridine biosynthesis bifunctional protein